MNVARILYPVEVLGPGKRVGIWVAGCTRGCKGCSNPELWQQRPEFEIGIDEILSLVDKIAIDHIVEGFTITGGEPMDQSKALIKLVKSLRRYSNDIIIYTGYLIEELRDANDDDINGVLENISVLIDGEYKEEENIDVLIRGSANQRLHILDSNMCEKYNEYLNNHHNQIQNFSTTNGIVSVGIHRKGF